MPKRKPLDHKILSEMLKNSKVSDRQMARKLGTSQPTITRRRSKLEKSLIQAYTILPNLQEMGFEIMALTFIAGRREVLTRGRLEEAQKKAKEWHSKHPNVIFAGAGNGMGWNGVLLSLHKSYSDYVKFKAEHDKEFAEYLADTQSFIMEVDPATALKPFNPSYLADFGAQES